MKKCQRIVPLVLAIFVLTLIGGTATAFAAAGIPYKKQWTEKRKEFNLPQKLGKVKLEGAFDKYWTQQDYKDPQKMIDLMDELWPDVTKYMKGLKALKKKKRNRKEIKKAEALDYLKAVMGAISKNKQNYKDILTPGLATKRKIGEAMKKLKKLKKNSPQSAFQKLNAEEIRSIGMKAKPLLKICAPCKVALDQWKVDANKIDKLVGANPFDGQDTLEAMEDGLEWLEGMLDSAGAW